MASDRAWFESVTCSSDQLTSNICFMNDKLIIAGREFNSRLIIGTGKYRDNEEMVAAFNRSGAEMITVAVRRVNITDRSQPSLLDFIDLKRFSILPNTAGCYTVDDAVR